MDRLNKLHSIVNKARTMKDRTDILKDWYRYNNIEIRATRAIISELSTKSRVINEKVLERQLDKAYKKVISETSNSWSMLIK